MLQNALGAVMNYIYGTDGIRTFLNYKATFGYPWAEVLDEINRNL